LHDSKSGLYNFTAGIDRTIGTDPTQSVHESALLRWDTDTRYRPESLKDYFRRTKDPRAT
jgi:hypothetical protein